MTINDFYLDLLRKGMSSKVEIRSADLPARSQYGYLYYALLNYPDYL